MKIIDVKAYALHLLGLLIISTSVSTHADVPDLIERFEQLPVLTPEVRVHEFTSFKRIAEVADYRSWLYSHNGELVMFHDEGPGCVTRLWVTGVKDTTSLLNFYFDGETNASFSVTPQELFDSGMFPYPLVAGAAQSAGGRICYVPFPYEQSLIITDAGVNDVPYYNITYENYPSDTTVQTWDGTESYTNLANYLNLTGSDPKPTAGNQVVSASVPITAGQTLTLLNVAASGSVQALEFDISPATPEIISNCTISMTFDGTTTVDAIPLDQFFGSAVGEVGVLSQPIGMRTNGNWYCYFPMPYWQSAQIQIHNASTSAVTNISYQVSTTPATFNAERSGYFHADRYSASYPKAASDLVLFDSSGTEGKFVGLSLYMEGDGLGLGGMYYLEGDVRVYVDDSKHPFIHGTGNEDWFNGAYYYNDYADRGANQEAELFSMPYHGLPGKYHFHGADNWTQAYRFNIADPINWTSALLLVVEHGQYPNYESGYYSCVSYSYQRATPASYEKVVIDTENANDYFYLSDGLLSTNTAKFITPKAEVDAPDVTLIGHSNVTASSFSVGIPPNNEGVILQSVTDFSANTNSALIYLNGQLAGKWSHVDLSYTNSSFGWGVNEVVLPASMTKGEWKLDVSVTYSGPATEYGFRLIPIAEQQQPGSAYQTWVDSYASLKSFTNMTDNLDGDTLNNLAEFALGGNPEDVNDSGHHFPLSLVESNNIEFLHVQRKGDHGLTYTLRQTDDLISNNWNTATEPAIGSGSYNADFNIVTNHIPLMNQGFLRLRIEQ